MIHLQMAPSDVFSLIFVCLFSQLREIVPKIAPFLSGIAQVVRTCWFGVSRETLTSRSLSHPNHPETRKVISGGTVELLIKSDPPSESRFCSWFGVSHHSSWDWTLIFTFYYLWTAYFLFFVVFGAFFLALSWLPTMLCGSRCLCLRWFWSGWTSCRLWSADCRTGSGLRWGQVSPSFRRQPF